VQGQIVERYQCNYYVSDDPKVKIKAGTLSLLWFSGREPLALYTYTRADLGMAGASDSPSKTESK